MVTIDTKAIAFVLLIIYPIVCMNTFFPFQAADVFEGNALKKPHPDSLYGCILECHQRTPSCLATSYNEKSRECQLLGKESNVSTTLFVSNMERNLHIKV